MELQIGQVVKAKAGRDHGGYFVVVGFAGSHVLLANGKERKRAKPKAKNPRHVNPTKTFLTEQQMTTDRQIYRALRMLFASAEPLPEGGITLG